MSAPSLTRKDEPAVMIQKRWRRYVTNVDYFITFILALFKMQSLVRKNIARAEYENKTKAARLFKLE